MDTVPFVDVEVLEQIVESANSDLLLFFIILAVVAVPVLWVLQRGNAARSQQAADREQNLITVILSNTEAMCGVKSSLDILAEAIHDDADVVM